LPLMSVIILYKLSNLDINLSITLYCKDKDISYYRLCCLS